MTNKTRTANPGSDRPVVELTGINPKSNSQRLADYWQKRRNNSQAREFERFFGIINCINDHFAAEASADIDWKARLLTVTVTQGGKTVYSATAEMGSPVTEVRIRAIRNELEALKVAALAGLKGGGMKSLREQIAEYRAERGYQGGYTIVCNSEVSGWTSNLDNPGGWMPGCVAIDEAGNQWFAKGGNDYDGAERWEAA